MAPVKKKAPGNAENDRPKKRKTHRYCCVKDCHNNDGTPTVRLFRFPSQPWDKERRQRWVAAVRRVNTDGSQWTPNDGSRICSEHFVNNDKSNIASHPAYCPTLFPAVYNTISVIPQDKASRFDSSSQAAKASSSQDGQPQDKTQSSAVRLLMRYGPCRPLFWTISFFTLTVTNVSTLQGSQTDETGIYPGQFSVYVCTLQDGNGCTQITHPDVCDTGVQVKPSVSTRQSGGDQKTGCFQGYRSVQHSPDALQDLCNITTAVFALLLSMLPKSSERSLDTPVPDKLLLFLMKLKLGLSYSSLAVLFSVHRTTASRHFRMVLATLSVATEKWIFRPPSSVILSMLPECFKANYPGCKMIIDCTEVRTEEPGTVAQQRALYSAYKSGYTLKFLVAVTPNGMICFRSKAYGGRCSDLHVTIDSGFLELVQEGDVILADKGFPGIKAGVEGSNAVLVMPPFFSGNGQYTRQEVQDTYNIAQVRVHVERMIQRIKNYNILNNRVPISLIPVMSDVFHMCCILANLQPAIIASQT
ncbi:unnamed protein product [Ixodes hexagonus]